MSDAFQIDTRGFEEIDEKLLLTQEGLSHRPKVLLLYGSLRERSFSRLMTEEAARVLSAFGAETKTFDPSGLPLPDDADETNDKVQELRDLVEWSEAMVWCSPEHLAPQSGWAMN